jgi:hypothetical protein
LRNLNLERVLASAVLDLEELRESAKGGRLGSREQVARELHRLLSEYGRGKKRENESESQLGHGVSPSRSVVLSISRINGPKGLGKYLLWLWLTKTW